MLFLNRVFHLLNKIYRQVIGVWFDVVRDPLIAASRFRAKKEKALILDMDWYRWCLDENETRKQLYGNSLLSKKADFIRIERTQLTKGMKIYEGVNDSNYEKLSYDGLCLWGVCKASICCELSANYPNMSDEEHVTTISRIYGEAVQIIKNTKKIFAKLKPDSVFICQGAVFDSRCIVEVARDMHINVVGIENSMVGGYVILDNLSGQIINRHQLAHLGGELLEVSSINDSDRTKAYDLWEEKLIEKSAEHRTGGIDTEAGIRKKLDLPEGKKIILLLGQVKTDASIVMDSNIYNDPVDMIEDVAGHFSCFNDAILVVRLHPKEFLGASPAGKSYDHMTYRELVSRKIDKITNIRIVESPEINTYTLINMSTAGVTINSQAGLEMCLLGKPVLVCGNAFYGRKGFTVDLGHRSAMRCCLKYMVEQSVLTKDQQELARSFFYLFWQRCLFDKEFTERPQRLASLFNL